MSPWADMTASGKSYRSNFRLDPMFGGKTDVKESDVEALLHSPIFDFCGSHDRKEPYISPAYGQYVGFPPMLFTVGSTELLYDDTMRIVEKLKKAGVHTKVIVGEKMFHVWPKFYRSSEDCMTEIKEQSYSSGDTEGLFVLFA